MKILKERSKVDKLKLSPQQDRRIKLSEEEKDEIRDRYKTGKYSLMNLANQYGVSKKTILLIVNPESKAKSDAYIKANWREFQQPREQRTQAIRKTREYKRDLLNKGELKENKENISKRDALDKIDELFGQEKPYMWSTYILPNGHFLNPDNGGNYWEEINEEPAYEHSDFIDYAYHNFRYGEDLFDGCIKMNVTYPYLSLPNNKPTKEQMKAIKEIINNKDAFSYSLSEIEDRVGELNNAKEPLMILAPFDETAYDLSVYSADDIIKEINKGYITKSFLKEGLNQEDLTLDLIENKYKDYLKYFFVYDKGNYISIDNLVINEKNRDKGIGQKVLSDILNYADKNNKIITLTPTREFGTYNRLLNWYKKNGFVENKGKNTDLTISDTMYRLPKAQLKEDLNQEELSNEYDSEGNQLTKAQVEFFKNSNVRDSNGRLLVCYHGTNRKFKNFKTPAYFTDNYYDANKYGDGKNSFSVYLDLKKPFVFDYDELYNLDSSNYDDNEDYINKELSIYNEELWRAIVDIFDGSMISYSYLIEVIEEMRRYDGIILYNSPTTWGNISQFIAFEPNQIKSITNKNPTNSDNINESLDISIYDEILNVLHNFAKENDSIQVGNIKNNIILLSPNGEIFGLAKGYTTHQDFSDGLLNYIYDTNEDLYYELSSELEGDYDNELIDVLEDSYGFITLNTGKTAEEDRRKIVIMSKPTQEQYRVLEDWLTLDENDLFLYLRGHTRWYNMVENTPKDIIKKIQKFFISNVLEENLLESKEDWAKFNDYLISGGVDEELSAQLIQDFQDNKQFLQGQERDIYYWMKRPIRKFIERIKEIKEQKQEKESKKEKIEQGAQLIYKDNDWYVYHITNYEASCKIGANTKWCITGSKRWANGNGRATWDSYEEEGIKIYFFIDRKNNRKYALAIYPSGDYEIFSEEDLELSYIPNAPIIKDMGVNYWDRDDKRLLEYLFIENKLPEDLTFSTIERVCELQADKGDDDVEVLIMLDPEDVYDIIYNNIPEDYIEHLAVESGYITPEDYELITGDEYDEDWGDDIPWFTWDTITDIVGKMTTLDDVCSTKNPFIKDNKYWFYYNNALTNEVSLYGFDSFEKLIRDGALEYTGLNFKQFLSECVDSIVYLLNNSNYFKGYIDDISKLGVSKEYLTGKTETELNENIDIIPKIKDFHLDKNEFKGFSIGGEYFPDDYGNGLEYYGIVDNGNHIGDIAIDNSSKDYIYIKGLYIEDDFRDKGYGRKTIEYLKDKEFPNISTMYLDSIPDAVGFWGKVGFIQFGDENTMTGLYPMMWKIR